MATIGDKGFFGLQRDQDVVARLAWVVDVQDIGGGQSALTVHVHVSEADDVYLSSGEQYMVQPLTQEGRPVRQLLVERVCSQVAVPTAGSWWPAP